MPRRNALPAATPCPVEHTLRRRGASLRTARLRRNPSLESVAANRISVSPEDQIEARDAVAADVAGAADRIVDLTNAGAYWERAFRGQYEWRKAVECEWFLRDHPHKTEDYERISDGETCSADAEELAEFAAWQRDRGKVTAPASALPSVATLPDPSAAGLWHGKP